MHEELQLAVGNLNPEGIAIDRNVNKYHTRLINFSHCLDLSKKEIDED
jgi:hypothetical protein